MEGMGEDGAMGIIYLWMVRPLIGKDDRPMKQIFFVWNYLFNIFLSFFFVALFFTKYKKY